MKPPKYIDNLPIYNGVGDTIGIFLGYLNNILYPVFLIHDNVAHVKLVNTGEGTYKVLCYNRVSDSLVTTDQAYGAVQMANALVAACGFENITAGTGNGVEIVLTDITSKFVKA